jgi:hypothetical protein
MTELLGHYMIMLDSAYQNESESLYWQASSMLLIALSS